MSDSTMTKTDAALWLDDQPVSTAEVMAVLRKESKLPELVRNLVLDRTLSQVSISPEFEAELVRNFRQHQSCRVTNVCRFSTKEPHHRTSISTNAQPSQSGAAVPRRTSAQANSISNTKIATTAFTTGDCNPAMLM